MRTRKVKKLIEKVAWRAFGEWMGGQTVGLYRDGGTDYYECDVQAFLEKLKTGYDRQEDPDAWD